MALDSALVDAIREGKSAEDLLMRVDRSLLAGREALVALMAAALFNVHLLGRSQVYADVHPRLAAAAIDITTSFEPLPFDQAIEFFRNKISVSPERFQTLSAAAKTKAFTIAEGANAQARDSIKELLDRSLSEGMTLKEFQNNAAEALDSAGLSARSPWYWETVYRTNMQTSYQAGRWQQITDPEVQAVRPYLRYVSALLPTTRPSHREKHGLVFRADDEFWNSWYPPNGFNCYCTVQTVSESLLDRRGWTVSSDKSFVYPNPDPGFGVNAGKMESI